MKKILLTLILGFLFNSCAFIIYNYRGKLDTEYIVLNTVKDTTTKIAIGKLIFNLSVKEKFYTRNANPAFDSLHFYGPDYHTFLIRLYEINDTIKIRLKYVGYHGFRSRPPHKIFIQTLNDSLKTKFKATQITYLDISNEKK
ncbi:MAG: hypothetical protein V4506_05125 [Bacteroidota bacterium]